MAGWRCRENLRSVPALLLLLAREFASVRLNCLMVCHIDRIWTRALGSEPINLVCCRLRVRLCAAHHRDSGTFARKSQSDRLPNPSSGACDNSHLVHKSIHQRSCQCQLPVASIICFLARQLSVEECHHPSSTRCASKMVLAGLRLQRSGQRELAVDNCLRELTTGNCHSLRLPVPLPT